jgi:hypothetical protein
MKRLSATALALVAGATIAFTATSADGAAPRVQLVNFACQRALDPPDRSVSVSAVMRPLPGTQKLEMQFSLLERAGGSATLQTVVRAGDLGVWISPKDPKLGQPAMSGSSASRSSTSTHRPPTGSGWRFAGSARMQT